ncbi:MAG TPA: oligoendopeptidase F [Candidatus Binatia bacterium]|nr:oligoendopeptidase F [Candidatus Binatia bacterium]
MTDRWDLAQIYPDTAAWKADLGHADAQLKDLARCKGHLADGAARLRQCFNLYADVAQRFARLQTYASLLRDEDTRVPAHLELAQQVELLGVRFSESSSFVQPEVLALGRKRLDAWLKAEPGLAQYRHPLEDIVRQAPHILDARGEDLLAKASLAAGTPDAVYGVLTGADIAWPRLTLEGTEVTLDQAAYTRYRAAQDRAERKQVFDAFWSKWKEYERTLGVTLYGQVKADIAGARVRNHGSARAAALDANAIPESVYDTLVTQAHANLPTLHRYLKLRGRLLGLSDLRYYDMYPSIVKADLRFPVADARRLTLEALQPLGPEYVGAMEQAFGARWMDVYPHPGKRSGAYMNPGAYAVHPYLLLNYNDDYESVTTLAHEWGHAMHSHLASRAQPFLTANYSIFTAEIASTVNEALLMEHMLKHARDDHERLYYLGLALEGLRLTYFRQTMFAEFERNIHAAVERGDTLTGESLTQSYCELLKQYHGDAEGVLKIDEPYCVEWAYIPHFYGNFYVYQYATSVAAASLFAQRILSGQPGASEQYLDLLRAGGSDYPYDLLKRAGIDMATAAPHQALFARMNRIMDEIEAILGKK